MKKKNSTLSDILSFFMITVGIILASWSLDCFLIPNLILDGGVTGVSIIISKLSNIPLGLLVFLINIPFVYIGYKNVGTKFLIKSSFSMILFAITLTLFEELPAVTDEILLATTFGGFFLGIGVGLVLRFGGCLDGTESVGVVISRKTSLSVGQVVFFFNLFIYTIAGFIFGFERSMYSLLTYFITFKVIDIVSEGLESGKAALIITESGTNIGNQIYEKLGRTVTYIQGNGMLTGEKEIMYCVVTRIEIPELKRIIANTNGSAFMTISDLSEIVGNHIKSNKKKIIKENMSE